MSQFVIRHPDTGGIGVASQEQIDMLWAPRGWGVVDIDPKFASTVVGVPISDLAELDVPQLHRVVAAFEAQQPKDRKVDLLDKTKPELVAVAEAAGLPGTGTKEELADRIIDHEQTTAAAAKANAEAAS